jgi:hypothetical protein
MLSSPTVNRQQQYNILNIITEHAPREYRETNNPRSRYMMSCPLPNHDDAQHKGGGGSFSVNNDATLYKCFGCGEAGNGLQLLHLLTNNTPQQPRRIRRQEQQHNTPKPVKKSVRKALQGVSILQLAEAKDLDPEHLHDDLAWRDISYFGKPAISIPYNDSTLRYRVGLDDGDRFRWERGATPCLYGLWNLESIKRRKFVVLVEGETDYAALDFHGFPVLGIPGAQNYKASWNQYLSDLEIIYVWQEPDEAGASMVRHLQENFPQLRVIVPPPGIKDACDMASQAGSGFAEMLQELLEEAEAPLDPYADREIRTSFIDNDNGMVWNNFGFVLDSFLDGKRDSLVAALRQGSQKDRDRANAISGCFTNYHFKKCQNTGEVMAQRVKCGDANCAICRTWLLKEFFDSKDEILQHGMENPTLYRIKLFSQRLHSDWVAKENDFRDIYRTIRLMLTRLTDSHGKAHKVAKDHLYGIRTRITGDVAHFEVVLFADYERGAIQLLEDHFRRQTKVDSVVEEKIPHGIQHAKEIFTALMSVPVDWDIPNNYLAWRAGTKGAKLIQGKGQYYKVSGGAKGAKLTPAQVEARVTCRVCGSCTPMQIPGYHPVISTPVREVTSPFTGNIYLEPVNYVAEIYGGEVEEGYTKTR